MVLSRLNKKGDISFLVSMALVLVSFMLIGGTIARFISKADDTSAETICQESIAIRSATGVQIGQLEAKTSPILCRTIDKKISGDRAEVQKQVADSMARCWWMFGEGRSAKNIFDNLGGVGGANKCFMCYTLALDDHEKFSSQSASISASDFLNYLATTQYPKAKKISDEDKKILSLDEQKYQTSYLNYIQSGGGKGAVFLALTSDQGIKPKRVYAVAYKAKADRCAYCDYLAGGGVLGAVGTGIFIAVTGTVTVPALIGVGTAGLVSGGALGYSAADFMNQFKGVYFLDSIMLVDISDQTSRDAFYNTCDSVQDIAGQ